MKCEKCGYENEALARFCSECGAEMRVESEVMDQANEVPPIEESAPEEPGAGDEQGCYEMPDTSAAQAEAAPAAAPAAAQASAQAAVPGQGMAIASLVCGVFSFVCCGFLMSVLAIVFGFVARSQGFKKGMSTAGIACGIVSLVLWAVMLIVFTVLSASAWTSAWY